MREEEEQEQEEEEADHIHGSARGKEVRGER